MKKRRTKLLAILLCFAALISALVVTVFADNGSGEDAMPAIKGAFADKQVGETKRLDKDGYIGIPVEITTYYDYATHGAAKTGYNGTLAIMYFVNTNIERVGTKSDVEIISSMLERGYIVTVFDYLNNKKATTPGLDWSAQLLRAEYQTGSMFTDKTKLPSGTYQDTFVVPAGYDVSYGNVFWEADKHAADGSLEKIVENWNTDLKNWNSIENKLVYWRNALGEQKTTEAGAEWFSDSAGKNAVDASDPNANYTKVKYTVATDITDCVGPDGTPIDLNLYMHIVYPTNPENEVPVAVLASSTEYLNTASTSSGLRPQHNGFLFRGYAGAVFDYLYQPMAQKDYWGYYDGQTSQGGITGDRMNYGLHLYSDKMVNTAAMRYLRYLAYTDGDTYSFDTESIGVFGNSKGGWFTFLGEAELKNYTVDDMGQYTKAELELLINNRITSYTSKRQFEGHRGESRYDNGITEAYTKNGVTIDGGELQPWLTYEDEEGNVHEILGYASWIYASNGSQYEDITEGHAPVFAALHLQDDFTTTHNLFSEVTKGLDVPSMYVIVDLGHTFAYGPEYYYGYDTYDAMFDFANYYLKNDAVKVVYTDPTDKTGAMSTTAPITIKFSGAVPASEIEKVTLTSGGKAVKGTWTSVRGNTEWTFTHEALTPGAVYTLTVPATLSGDNGVAMGETYTATYYTESEGVSTVKQTNGSLGTYFTLTAPTDSKASDAAIRFYVSNDAANAVELYTVSGFNAANPSASTKGELVETVYLNGEGYYEIDVTKYVLEADAGSEMTFLLTVKKNAGESTKVTSFASSISAATLGSYVRGSVATAPDGTSAAKVYVTANIKSNGSKQYPNEKPFYANCTTAMTVKNIFGSNLTESDLGRKYRITVRLYDTDTRIVQLALNRVTGDMVHDRIAENYNYKTTAGEWQELSFEHTVYEPLYGDAGLVAKTLTVMLGSTGKDESAVYISDITVTEITTGVELGDTSLVLSKRGDAYKKNGAGNPFSIGDTTYATLYSALLGAKNGDTVKLNSNYTITSSDGFTAWGSFGNITLDLNGYNLISETSAAIVNAAATTTATANITIKNGSVYLSHGALVGYAGSTAAGKGKSVNVTIEDVNVYNTKGSTLSNLISASTIESASGANVSVTLKNVNIDYKKLYNSKNPVTLLSNGSAALKVSYTLVGGSITLDGISGVTVYNTFKSTTLVKDTNGSYTSIYLPEGINLMTLAVTVGNSAMAFAPESADLGTAKYVAAESEYVTRFGIVPEAYSNADAYPFVLFDENGNFKAAYTKWLGTNGSGGVITAARNYVVNAWDGTSYGTDPKEAYIVLRRDYTYESAESYDNLAQTQGAIHIDLGGHTLSASTFAKPILAADSKGYSGALGQKIYPTSIYFYNGKLMHGKSGIVSMKTWDSIGDGSIVNKDFNFTFTNVTFGFVNGADSVGLLAHSLAATTKTYAAPYNFTFNDCTFDLRTTASKYSSGIVVFNTNTADKYIKVTYNVNGGTIIANDPSKVTLVSDATNNYGSSAVFGKGSDESYLKYQTLTSSPAPSGSYKSETSKLGFVATATSGNDTIYEMVVTSADSFYDNIPDNYASTSDYPFAVFDKDGGFLYAKSLFKDALSSAKTHISANTWDPVNKTYGTNPKKAYILVRADYTTSSSDNSYQDIAQGQGEIVIDMNGHTITQGSTDAYGIFGRTTSKGWSGSGDEKIFYTTYTIKNGSFLVRNKSLFTLGAWETVGNGTLAGKLFTFNFSNVDIGYVSGATATNLLFSYNAASVSPGCTLSKAAPFVMNFDDCTFDIKTNAPSSPKLFNAAASNGQWVQNTITVKGGNIIAKSLSASQLYAVESVYGSSVTFAKNGEGKYTALTLDSSSTAPTCDVKNDRGETMRFAKESSTLYSLSTLITDYGVIPEKYASTSAYPYVVFKGGQFVFATNIWGKNGEDSALHKAKADGSVILLRRDVDFSEARYNNLSQATGSITIDLNGFTISLKQTGSDPWLYAQKKTQFDTTVTVKNGTILTGKNEVVRFDSWAANGNYTGGCNFNIIFDGVTIGVLSGYSPASIFMAKENQTNAVETLGSLTVKNCVIDVSNAPRTTIFAVDDESGLIDVTVNVSNTVIKGNDLSAAVFVPELDNTATSVTFADDVKLYVKSGKGSAEVFNTADGKKIFVATTEKDNGYTVYKLAASDLAVYTPKMSITLENELILNVYIPVNCTQSFTFNGEKYDDLTKLDGAVKTLDDGNDYYLISVALGSSEAAREIKLSANIVAGDDAAKVSYTFSIPKYSKKVLDNANATEIEKTLAKDVLAYVKAAYVYFGTKHNTEAEIERVVALIESVIGDYVGAPAISGVTETVAPVKSVTLNLDARPTVRFYLTSGAPEFYANGRKLNTVEGKDDLGAYVDLDVYAYALAETITYAGGSYHISSFLEGSRGEAHEALVSAFVKYVESAAAYRRSVIG